jgi:hypothetical protein
MTSTAFVADQEPGARAIRNNQRSEMVALALPAGKYALIANGTVEGTDRRSVHGFIESGATIVHRQNVTLEVDPVFVPFPTMFGVLDLPSGGTVRVSCLVSEFTRGDAAGIAFRLMAWSVDSIGA